MEQAANPNVRKILDTTALILPLSGLSKRECNLASSASTRRAAGNSFAPLGESGMPLPLRMKSEAFSSSSSLRRLPH